MTALISLVYASPRPPDYDGAINAIRNLLARAEMVAGGTGTVGVGVPGSADPRDGKMRNANVVFLNGRQFQADLEHALARPIRIANDANCMALSEAVDGAAAGGRSAFAVIIGTGVGGGLVVDGQIVEGANGIGGEWGHVPLPWMTEDEFPGPACWCGQRGCLERTVSGSGFQDDYRQVTGAAMNGPDIIAAARAGDASAGAALDRYTNRLARALAMVANIVDPDVFVLAGGMSNVAELYGRLPEMVRAYSFGKHCHARVEPARWGDASGVRGAARLWPAQ